VRSYLRTFASLFPDGWADELRGDLSWYAEELSHLRDLDVMTARVKSLSPKEVNFTERAVAFTLLTERRSAELQRLLGQRLDPRHRLAVIRLESIASNFPLTSRAAAPVDTELPRLLRQPYENVRAAVRAFAKSPSDRKVHQLRIRAKELRYAAELAGGAFGKPARRLARAAERIQTTIGDDRDAFLAAAFLAAARKELPKPRPDITAVSQALSTAGNVDVDRLAVDVQRLRRRWRELASALSASR
jgi:CHAD domain-containing protein